jgi:hypothetical protein
VDLGRGFLGMKLTGWEAEQESESEKENTFEVWNIVMLGTSSTLGLCMRPSLPFHSH